MNLRPLLTTKKLLTLILALALVLRVYDLSSNPPGFYTDEASIGYNAYKILTTAHDEHNKLLPLFFEAFGEYKNAFAIYPVVPFIAIFGSTIFAVRLTQVTAGLLVILALYYLASALFGKKTGLAAAFILAISPWHIHTSRYIIESHNFFLLFIIVGTYFFLKAEKSSWKQKDTLLCVVFFGLSFFTYFATRVFTPLYLLSLVVIFYKQIFSLFKKNTKLFFVSILIFTAILVPYFEHIASGKAFSRFRQVSYQNTQNTTNVANRLKLYFDHFNPSFVFKTGDSDFPGQMSNRHSVNGIGLFYKWQLPFFILGILSLLLKKRKRNLIIISMLILYPLGSVIANSSTPYATRSVIGAIPYAILIALGITFSFKLTKLFKNYAKLAQIILIITFCFFSLIYLNRFLKLQEVYKLRAYGYSGFQQGSQQIIEYFMENQKNYQIMIIEQGFDAPNSYINFFSRGLCNNCYTKDPDYKNTNPKLIAAPPYSQHDLLNKYNLKTKQVYYYPDGTVSFLVFEATSKTN